MFIEKVFLLIFPSINYDVLHFPRHFVFKAKLTGGKEISFSLICSSFIIVYLEMHHVYEVLLPTIFSIEPLTFELVDIRQLKDKCIELTFIFYENFNDILVSLV